jgi:hypothetical protein
MSDQVRQRWQHAVTAAVAAEPLGPTDRRRAAAVRLCPPPSPGATHNGGSLDGGVGVT